MKTVITSKQRELIDRETGELITVEQVNKLVYGTKNFWKCYLMDFLSILGIIDNKQVDIFIYIVENTNQSNNVFLGTYKMRHRLGLRKLNRTSAHRLAMLRNMMCSLIKHEAIKTTLPKAKELRRVVEPMITLAKDPTPANKRLAFNRLRDREVVVKLFNEIGPRFANRNGGYTRIIRTGIRRGDAAETALIELVK